ncbi:MAG TPA: VOC family protein [Candidatus Saccharimonadales bacterium]|nr:VOC family protein [Candidatus Saccharimonadales bacterium]
MARVSTYLNFDRQTEEAFNFYKTVFGTEFIGDISRMGDIPPKEGQPPVPEADKNLIMNIALPILAGHVIMGTDTTETMGFKLVKGNTMYVMLEPDTRAETDKLFKALADGGHVEVALQEMFWGDYYGSLTDKYGIKWMFDCTSKT